VNKSVNKLIEYSLATVQKHNYFKINNQTGVVSTTAVRFRTFRPGLGFGQRYHVDRHSQLTLKQLRLSVLNEMHTNSYTGPRLHR
jgi:hypothetical protein